MKITKTWFTPALLSLALFAGACGKKNESGKSSGRYFGSVGTYTGVAPANTTNPYVSQLFQQFPCQTGSTGYNGNANQRIGTGIQMNFTVAANSTYVGVTTLGDIAVLTGDNQGRAVTSLYICPRYGAAQGQSSLSQPIPGRTLAGCRFDELVVTANIPGFAAPLRFAPVDYIPQLRQNFCNFY